MGVSSVRVSEAIRAGNLSTRAEVAEATRAGSACGTCHNEIDEILCALGGRAVPDWARFENRQVCADETERRVEASIEFTVAPLLARGLFVELVAVDGLRVEVHLGPKRDPDVEAWISEKLRRLVCSDLEVLFV
jgi:bacterioferritin-associated ferredoxin